MKRAREISRAAWRHVWTFCLLSGVVIGTGTMMADRNPSWFDVVEGIVAPVIFLWWAIARIAADVIAIQHKDAIKRLKKAMVTPEQARTFVTDSTWSTTDQDRLDQLAKRREDGSTG